MKAKAVQRKLPGTADDTVDGLTTRKALRKFAAVEVLAKRATVTSNESSESRDRQKCMQVVDDQPYPSYRFQKIRRPVEGRCGRGSGN